jgi:hypothetical protein
MIWSQELDQAGYESTSDCVDNIQPVALWSGVAKRIFARAPSEKKHF